MSLTEIMSGSGLSVYTEIALLLFLAAFIGIVWRAFSPSRAETLRRAARMPLDDDTPQTPRDSGDRT